MAWQLHYTSTRSGPTGRAGFQYVAATPGLPGGWETAAAPYLVYQPPPDDTFPDSFGYDVVDGHALLVRCRYLGRDYSGRSGNFFGHAVIADTAELEGLRPIELWDSPHWEEDGATELDELVAGRAFTPEALGRWLGLSGSYDLLARLLDRVVEVLRRGHGRVVLVGDDTEAIAHWIALVSYSLPTSLAARLSFVTYSADPESAPQCLVGTTPAVWDSLHSPASRAFFLSRAPASPEPGFGRTAAECWRALDLDGLDAIGELAELMAGRLGTDPLEMLSSAAATRDQATTTEHVRAGEGDLAALLEAVPSSTRDQVVAGALDGLSAADADIRLRMLTDRACDLLFDSSLDWGHRPAISLLVLTSVGRRHPDARLTVTRTLVELAEEGLTTEVESALTEIWSARQDAMPSGWSGFRARLRGREG